MTTFYRSTFPCCCPIIVKDYDVTLHVLGCECCLSFQAFKFTHELANLHFWHGTLIHFSAFCLIRDLSSVQNVFSFQGRAKVLLPNNLEKNTDI